MSKGMINMGIETIPYKDPVNDPNSCFYGKKFVKAAIRIGDIVYLAWRHHLIINELGPTGKYKPKDFNDQGFVDQNGYYYGNRKFCGYLAWRNGQIKKQVRDLFSEDLWDINGNPV
jgi:hypothetical protein